MVVAPASCETLGDVSSDDEACFRDDTEQAILERSASAACEQAFSRAGKGGPPCDLFRQGSVKTLKLKLDEGGYKNVVFVGTERPSTNTSGPARVLRLSEGDGFIQELNAKDLATLLGQRQGGAALDMVVLNSGRTESLGRQVGPQALCAPPRCNCRQSDNVLLVIAHPCSCVTTFCAKRLFAGALTSCQRSLPSSWRC